MSGFERRTVLILILTLILSGMMPAAIFAQSNRFPAPLGLDRVLNGRIAKNKTSGNPVAGKKTARYILKSDHVVYQLQGHERELRKSYGKRVRITGNVVGNNVKVNSVEPAKD